MKNNKLRMYLQAMRKIQEIKNNSNCSKISTNLISQIQLNNNIVTIIAPEIIRLQKIHQNVQLKNVIQDFVQYQTLPSQILGKKSSKIITSRSQKYCLKVIQEQDLNKILSMIDLLEARFIDKQSNCLIEIYFIFMLEYLVSGVKFTDRYIIMPNLRNKFDHSIRLFDLKGHLQSRIIDEQDFKDFKFGKDENFIKSPQLKLMKEKICKQKLIQMIQKIEQNVGFLSEQNIIDYSLILSIQKVQNHNKNQGYCQQIYIDNKIILKWAIIDYFQIYNQKKKMENRFKSIFKKSISSIEPPLYYKRLIKFLQMHFLLQNQ